uniref:LAM_G_DOMAIN domain-containing protein n=1 Tax=Macrostomum lignano TaxID=282301 RepID=A0A1I8ITJ8_9PLAT
LLYEDQARKLLLCRAHQVDRRRHAVLGVDLQTPGSRWHHCRSDVAAARSSSSSSALTGFGSGSPVSMGSSSAKGPRLAGRQLAQCPGAASRLGRRVRLQSALPRGVGPSWDVPTLPGRTGAPRRPGDLSPQLGDFGGTDCLSCTLVQAAPLGAARRASVASALSSALSFARAAVLPGRARGLRLGPGRLRIPPALLTATGRVGLVGADAQLPKADVDEAAVWITPHPGVRQPQDGCEASAVALLGQQLKEPPTRVSITGPNEKARVPRRIRMNVQRRALQSLLPQEAINGTSHLLQLIGRQARVLSQDDNRRLPLCRISVGGPGVSGAFFRWAVHPPGCIGLPILGRGFRGLEALFRHRPRLGSFRCRGPLAPGTGLASALLGPPRLVKSTAGSSRGGAAFLSSWSSRCLLGGTAQSWLHGSRRGVPDGSRWYGRGVHGPSRGRRHCVIHSRFVTSLARQLSNSAVKVGPGRLSFEFADDTFLPTTKRDDIAFGFQTAKESAPLLRVDARDRSSDYILISIVNQRIRVEYNMKSSTISLESSLVVSDGRYHRIRFLREETRGSLYIDDHTPLIKHPDASVGTTFNWQKYIQIGRLATAPKSGIRRRRRSSPAVADESQQYFQGYLVGLVFNGLPLNRIAAGDEAVKDLARLHIEREGDVQQVADFVPKLPGFPPVDRPEYYRNPDLMPTTVAPSPTPIRCSAENRYRMDCVNDARGSSSSSGEGAAVDGDKTSAKPPVQAAKINVFVIVAVGAAGAILLLVFFCLIYRCRSKNEGSYRVDETQNFAADGIGGPGIQLDPALKPLRSDGFRVVVVAASRQRRRQGCGEVGESGEARHERVLSEAEVVQQDRQQADELDGVANHQGQQRLGHLVHRRLAPAGVRVGRCAAVGADGRCRCSSERQGVVESGQNGLRQGVDSAVDAQHGAGLLVVMPGEAKLTNSQMCRLNSAAAVTRRLAAVTQCSSRTDQRLLTGLRWPAGGPAPASCQAGRHQRAVVDAVVVADAQHEQQREQQDGGDQLVAAQQQRQVAEGAPVDCHVTA